MCNLFFLTCSLSDKTRLSFTKNTILYNSSIQHQQQRSLEYIELAVILACIHNTAASTAI